MEEFCLDHEDSNFMFLADLPDDRIGIFSAWQYSNINFKKLTAEVDPTYTL
jgi:hypothetical protein